MPRTVTHNPENPNNDEVLSIRLRHEHVGKGL